MSTTSTFHSDTHTKIKSLVDSLMDDLGLDFHADSSPGFRLVLEVAPDGQSIAVTCTPSDKGMSNPFNTTGDRENPQVIRGDNLP